MGDSLKLVPAGVDFLFLLFFNVVKPILLVQELFTAVAALYSVKLVSFFGVCYKLVVAAKPCMALVTLGLLSMEEAHEDHSKRWLLSWIMKSKKKRLWALALTSHGRKDYVRKSHGQPKSQWYPYTESSPVY
jgi:hypothetical protein